MKSLVNIVIGLCLSVSAFGQWAVGPKVSIGTISQGEEKIRIIPNSDRIPVNMSFLGGNSVKSVGFMAYNDIGPGFLQFEVLGTKYDLEYATNPGQEDEQVLREQHYMIELPIAAGFKVADFKVGVGPVLEINAGLESDLSILEGYKKTSRKADGGFQGLVGYKKGIFNIDMRYVYKFSSVVDGFGLGEDILKLNKSANRLSLSVGMVFGGPAVLKDAVKEIDEVVIF